MLLLAHPGHGILPSDTPGHYLLEPLHALSILVLVVFGFALWRTLFPSVRR